MKYKAVLFDLDGTLLDTTEGVINAVRKTIQDNGLKMPDEGTLKKFVGPPMQNTMKLQYGFNDENALKIANEFRENYRKYSLFQASLYSGVLPMMAKLYKCRFQIGVATNKSHENAESILRQFGISEYCSYVKGSDLKGKLSKKDIIESCLNSMKLKKEETVLVGDSVYDLNGAMAAEIDFIAVTYGFGFKKGEKITSKRCIFTADTVKQLENYLTKK